MDKGKDWITPVFFMLKTNFHQSFRLNPILLRCSEIPDFHKVQMEKIRMDKGKDWITPVFFMLKTNFHQSFRLNPILLRCSEIPDFHKVQRLELYWRLNG